MSTHPGELDDPSESRARPLTGAEVGCFDLVEWLDVYLDGELASGPRAALARHLAGCADCRTYLDAYQKTIELVRTAGFEDAELGQELPRELMRSILASGRGC